jgi:hypothetical protein
MPGEERLTGIRIDNDGGVFLLRRRRRGAEGECEKSGENRQDAELGSGTQYGTPGHNAPHA